MGSLQRLWLQASDQVTTDAGSDSDVNTGGDGLLEVFEEDKPPSSLEGAKPEPARSSSPVVPKSWSRHQLARGLLILLAALGLALIVAVALAPERNQGDLRELAAILYPPLVTLAGTSFAFFYGSSRRDEKDDG